MKVTQRLHFIDFVISDILAVGIIIGQMTIGRLSDIQMAYWF